MSIHVKTLILNFESKVNLLTSGSRAASAELAAAGCTSRAAADRRVAKRNRNHPRISWLSRKAPPWFEWEWKKILAAFPVFFAKCHRWLLFFARVEVEWKKNSCWIRSAAKFLAGIRNHDHSAELNSFPAFYCLSYNCVSSVLNYFTRKRVSSWEFIKTLSRLLAALTALTGNL